MNPSASEWKPKFGGSGSKTTTTTTAPADADSSSLRATARVFVPGGGGAPPPPPQHPGNDNGYDPTYDMPPPPPPPPPPGPPPPGSPTIHTPGMIGSPTGAAPPAYGSSTPGAFPSGPQGGHMDPYGDDGSNYHTPSSPNKELSAKAAPFSPGSAVSTPVTGSPQKPQDETTATTESKMTTAESTAAQDTVVAGETAPETAGGTNAPDAGGSPLNVLTVETTPKPKLEPFKNSKMPLPKGSPKEPVAPPPQLNGSWSLHVDEHAIAIGTANPQQAFHDPVGIATVNCIENFWKLWNNVPQPSTRTPSFTYYWFRKDVKPNWEDPRNKNGGTINITLYDRDRIGIQDKAVLDDSFMTAVLLCTGESLAEANCVNGVSLKIRNRATTMQIWTNVATKKELQSIAECLKKELKPYCNEGSLADGKIDFFTHQQVIKSVTTAAPKPKKGKPGAPVKAAVREADFQF